jgi:hypothetical protein
LAIRIFSNIRAGILPRAWARQSTEAVEATQLRPRRADRRPRVPVIEAARLINRKLIDAAFLAPAPKARDDLLDGCASSLASGKIRCHSVAELPTGARRGGSGRNNTITVAAAASAPGAAAGRLGERRATRLRRLPAGRLKQHPDGRDRRRRSSSPSTNRLK